MYNGLHSERLEPDAGNPREVAFAKRWAIDNAPVLIHYTSRPLDLIPDHTERDEAVAATVIQWLGSNVGMAFLQAVIESSPEVRDWLSRPTSQPKDPGSLQDTNQALRQALQVAYDTLLTVPQDFHAQIAIILKALAAPVLVNPSMSSDDLIRSTAKELGGVLGRMEFPCPGWCDCREGLCEDVICSSLLEKLGVR
jgi:hypothetical protein